jgi:hypothetical protein
MPAQRRPRIDWPRALAALMLAIALWLIVRADTAATLAP